MRQSLTFASSYAGKEARGIGLACLCLPLRLKLRLSLKLILVVMLMLTLPNLLEGVEGVREGHTGWGWLVDASC